MKKQTAFLLALALAASTGTAVYAESGSSTNDTEILVKGTYQAPSSPADTVSVDIVWEDMTFVYTGPYKDNWDPKTHEYKTQTEGSWAWKQPTGETKTAPEITVTNHSNTGVKASFAFSSDVDGLNGSFTNLTDSALTLDTAVGTDADKAPTASTAFSVTGSGIDADQQLGTITVTVAKAGTTGGGTSGGDTPATGPVAVTTFDALEAAVNHGGTITLGGDITTTEHLVVPSNTNVVIDFAGHTLTSSANTAISNGGNLTLRNGTLAGTGDATTLITGHNESTALIAKSMTITSKNSYALNSNLGGTTELTDCTLTTESTNIAAVFLNRADATLNNCTVVSTSANTISLSGGFPDSSGATLPSAPQGATLTISEGTTATGTIEIFPGSVPCTIVVKKGCSFNPEEHYSSSNATLTNNNNGTWTITTVTSGGDTSEA